MEIPDIYGLFHRQFEGDEALLLLAKQRFDEVGIGAEIHPVNVAEALAQWPLVPNTKPRHFVHLPRHFDVLSSEHRRKTAGFARALAGRARGIVVHDKREWQERLGDVLGGLRALDRILEQTPGAPAVYVEYASELPLEWFTALAQATAELSQTHVSVDTGHIVLSATRRRFEDLRRNIGLFSLALDAERARACLGDIDRAMKVGSADLLATIDRISELGRPVHFHLHDAHPLSLLSRYGISDHLSFMQKVPVSTLVNPDGWVPTLLGAAGLEQIVKHVTSRLGPDQITFTLEIQPTTEGRRQALGRFGSLFSHWKDLAQAELMNAWLEDLVENAALLKNLCEALSKARE